MPDSEAKKKWIAENTIVFSLKLMKKADADIIAYLDSKGAEGVKKGTVIKQALREYMKNHPDPKPEYRYGMRLRGYSPGAQPKGVLRREDDTSGKYHDIIVYDRQLSAAEVASYELDEL